MEVAVRWVQRCIVCFRVTRTGCPMGGLLATGSRDGQAKICAFVLSCGAIAKFALQGATLLRSVALNVQCIVI